MCWVSYLNPTYKKLNAIPYINFFDGAIIECGYSCEKYLDKVNPENLVIPGNAKKAFIPLICKSWFRQLVDIQSTELRFYKLIAYPKNKLIFIRDDMFMLMHSFTHIVPTGLKSVYITFFYKHIVPTGLRALLYWI